MQRSQLEHAIRAACTIIERDEVLVIGSQSILGSWPDYELPEVAVLSNEADIMAIDDNAELVTQLADDIEGVAGELSLFHSTHGFYIDGVDHSTAVLPDGWRSRLVQLSNENTRGKVGWCLDPHDLCIAKLVAHRAKDLTFVLALIDDGKIDTEVLSARLAATDAPNAEAVATWLASTAPPAG